MIDYKEKLHYFQLLFYHNFKHHLNTNFLFLHGNFGTVIPHPLMFLFILFIYLFVYLFIYLCIYAFMYLFMYFYLLVYLFIYYLFRLC